MYKHPFLAFIIFLVSCGSDESNSDSNNVPVANNDFVSIIEDTTTLINSIVFNDEVPNNTSITSFDASSEKGGIVTLNNGQSLTYTPPNSFVGQDEFTYTLCDDKTSPNCSTASVFLEIIDQGSPTANNDTVVCIKSEDTIFKNLLKNDTIKDDAVIVSIDSSMSSGNLVLNDDKTIAYTPLANYEGLDQFTYTICDDDSPNPTCDSATVTISVVEAISFNIPSHLASYYDNLLFSENNLNNLYVLEELTRSKHTTILTYIQRHHFLYDADQDPSNSENVLLMYSSESRFWRQYTSPTNSYPTQTFNTEHVYPRSLLSLEIAETDLHHLRTCDSGVNSERSNRKFVNGSGSYKKVGSGWYPGDQWKGDVARMVFYLNIRYGESISDVSSLELLLQWNVEDPVSEIEENRNNVIESAQGNRNPFIDNPYLATLSWGGESAENKWN